MGVWSSEVIPRGTRFGPLLGQVRNKDVVLTNVNKKYFWRVINFYYFQFYACFYTYLLPIVKSVRMKVELLIWFCITYSSYYFLRYLFFAFLVRCNSLHLLIKNNNLLNIAVEVILSTSSIVCHLFIFNVNFCLFLLKMECSFKSPLDSNQNEFVSTIESGINVDRTFYLCMFYNQNYST